MVFGMADILQEGKPRAKLCICDIQYMQYIWYQKKNENMWFKPRKKYTHEY